MPIGSLTAPGKSATLANSLDLYDEFKQMFGATRTTFNRGDTLAGASAYDVRAAGFDVVYAPTYNNPLHVRIISAQNTFDEAGRE